jgi:hypothetical protein
MKPLTRDLAISIAAGAICYGVFAYVEALSVDLRLLSASGVVAASLAIAWLLRGGTTRRSISIGDRIRARKAISVKDVEVLDDTSDLRIGTRLRSRGQAQVKNIHVGKSKPNGGA